MKNIVLLSLIFLYACSCNNKKESSEGHVQEKNETNKVEHFVLPFIGKRNFETRPGVSGTGTPHRFVEITRDSNVIFSFEQENQADGTITKEKYAAGKYKPVMKCIFKKLENEVKYYEFDADTIYEVDANKHRIRSDECCDFTNGGDNKNCLCKGILDTTEAD